MLSAVAALGSTDVWAAGSTLPVADQRAYLAHWDGVSWEQVAAPRPPDARTMELFGLDGVGATGLWVVGDYVSDPLNPMWIPLAFHGC